MRRVIAAALCGLFAIAVSIVGITSTSASVPASNPTTEAPATAPGDVVIGQFNRAAIRGVSTFVQAGTNAKVRGQYAALAKHHSYFTVAYANTTCDPAQAFPVGPLRTSRFGTARLAKTVPLGAVDLGATRSVSVRTGDNNRDLDHDGKKGPGDVVAVAGHPSVGLIACDSHPVVVNAITVQ